MPHPFEVTPDYLRDHLDEMVAVTFADLQSQFLILPRSDSLMGYPDFQDAYEVLKRHTTAFTAFNEDAVWAALRENATSLLVLRTILGLSPPEWADLARTERASDITQGYARSLDTDCRANRHFFALGHSRDTVRLRRTAALVSVAVEHITQGAPPDTGDTVHRLGKVDTQAGLRSLQYIAEHDTPYAMLLYERYLGRPFASYRDSISGHVGDVMEFAVEDHLTRSSIGFRKPRRAERVPGYDQAPDFFVPDEFNPGVLVEAKITSDDGTARDKATRIFYLAGMRDQRLRNGQRGFEVVACLDGRGFGVRREDMRKILIATDGKVFTLATLDQLIMHTGLQNYAASNTT